MHVEVRGCLAVDSHLQLWVLGAELKLSDLHCKHFYTLSYLVDPTFVMFSSGE